jgi:chemotaxis protein CheZ
MTAGKNGSANGLDPKLHSEIMNLIQYIQRLRVEIAGIANQRDEQTAFDSMADRLDAIVASTAEATDSILAAMEDIDGAVDELRGQSDPEKIEALCDRISEKTMGAMEACSFQDLTGQRVNKVVASLKFVEERVNAMADLCGRAEIESIDDDVPAPPQQMDDGIALDGPQRAGEAVSQDEIDKLFS